MLYEFAGCDVTCQIYQEKKYFIFKNYRQEWKGARLKKGETTLS